MDGLLDDIGAEEAAQGALVRAKELRADGGFGGGGCGAAGGRRGRLWRRCGGGGRRGERWRERVRGGGRVMRIRASLRHSASGRGVRVAGSSFRASERQSRAPRRRSEGSCQRENPPQKAAPRQRVEKKERIYIKTARVAPEPESRVRQIARIVARGQWRGRYPEVLIVENATLLMELLYNQLEAQPPGSPCWGGKHTPVGRGADRRASERPCGRGGGAVPHRPGTDL
jgi:hypothetical protein